MSQSHMQPGASRRTGLLAIAPPYLSSVPRSFRPAVTDHLVDLPHPSPEHLNPPLPLQEGEGLLPPARCPCSLLQPIIDLLVEPCCDLAHPYPCSLCLQQHTHIAHPCEPPTHGVIDQSQPTKKSTLGIYSIQQQRYATYTAFHCPSVSLKKSTATTSKQHRCTIEPTVHAHTCLC